LATVCVWREMLIVLSCTCVVMLSLSLHANLMCLQTREIIV